MAKTKIDFRSIEIPAVAKTPLYAGVGAGDLAVTAVLEYVADVQKKLTDVQKDVQSFDPKKAQKSALEQAKARRSAVEARVSELQAEALALPTKSQAAAKQYVDSVTGTVVGTYSELAKRGEAVVRGTKLPSTATVEVKLNTTNPAAKKNTRTPAVKKAADKAATKTETATKTTARKAPAPAKKATTATKTAAKKTAGTTKTAAKKTTTAAKKTASNG